MATLKKIDDTGLTLYVVLRDAALQLWNTATLAMEAWNAANYTSYDTAATEQGTTGFYAATSPAALPVGAYSIDWRSQQGGSPAQSDPCVGLLSAYWDGANWFADWAIKLAQAASPVTDSPELNLKIAAADVAGLDGAAMRGTDSAALAATALSNLTWTDAKAGYLTGAIPTAAAVADAVLDEALAAHDTEDTLGNVLNDLTEESGGVYRLTSVALGAAPTGTTASYTVSSTTVGAAPEVNITQYQHQAFGPIAITAATAQTGDSHSFLVYDPNVPATVLWSLTTLAGEISVGGSGNLTITLVGATADPDQRTATAGEYAYILRNTTDDTVICVGALTIEPVPTA